MKNGRKCRFYPEQHSSTFAQWIGCVRVLYNGKADEEAYFTKLYQMAKFSNRVFPIEEGVSEFSFDQAYAHLKPSKAEAPWMYQVPSQIYRNAMYQRMQAWQNYWRDPVNVGKPKKRKRGENDAILLTKELFRFKGTGLIEIGTVKNPIGVFHFREHRGFKQPNSVTIKRDKANRWWLSFSFEDTIVVNTEEQVLTKLNALTNTELTAKVTGFDRGIVQQVTGSDGKVYNYSEQKQKRFEKYQRRQKTLQKKLSRQVMGSKRRAKTKVKLNKNHAKLTNARVDHAHQVSHLVVQSPATVLVFEDLKLANMIKSAKGTLAEPGTNVAAKSGLNKALLHQGLGRIRQFIKYKAKRTGKLVITVPPYNTSRRCSRCGHTEKANRKGSHFKCLNHLCGHVAHADANAAANIKQDGLNALLSQLELVLGRKTVKPFVEATTLLPEVTQAPVKRSRELDAPTSMP